MMVDERAWEVLERVRRFAMPDGAVRARKVLLRQIGEMRLAVGGRWLGFRAEQTLDAAGVDFRWLARVRVAPLVTMRVVDAFEGGHGALDATWLGVVPIARARGAAFDKGELMRGLAEMPWRPAAFAETPAISWTVAPGGGLRAAYDDGATRAGVEFEVDDEGRVLSARAPDRPRTVGKAVVENAWSGTFGAYAPFEGLRVPTRAEVTWHLPEGGFTYYRGRVTSLGLVR